MEFIEVRTQAELDAAVAAGKHAICVGGGEFTAWGNSTVTARENSTVTAWENVIVRGFNLAVITATIAVVVVTHGNGCKVTGGIHIEAKPPTTATEWCDHYGVPVVDGVAVLFKGLYDNFKSPHGLAYDPGTQPVASDWDGGTKECGGGLHFSPHPDMTLQYNESSKRFVACPVAIADMRPPKPSDDFGNKIKAKGCCDLVWECDIQGKRITPEFPKAKAVAKKSPRKKPVKASRRTSKK